MTFQLSTGGTHVAHRSHHSNQTLIGFVVKFTSTDAPRTEWLVPWQGSKWWKCLNRKWVKSRFYNVTRLQHMWWDRGRSEQRRDIRCDNCPHYVSLVTTDISRLSTFLMAQLKSIWIPQRSWLCLSGCQFSDNISKKSYSDSSIKQDRLSTNCWLR